MYFCLTTTSYAIASFVPTILHEFGYTAAQSQLQTIPVYVVATTFTLAAAWTSDRLRHRYGFAILSIAIATIGYIILLCQGGLSVGVKYLAVSFVVTGSVMVQPIFIVWLANKMGGHYKRAVGSAIQIGFGNGGGIVASNIFITSQAPRYLAGYGTTFGLLLLCGIVCTVFFLCLRAENKKRDRGERDYLLQLPQNELDNIGDNHPGFRYTL